MEATTNRCDYGNCIRPAVVTTFALIDLNDGDLVPVDLRPICANHRDEIEQRNREINEKRNL